MYFLILVKYWSLKCNFCFFFSDYGFDRNLNLVVVIYECDILIVEFFFFLESYEWIVKLFWKDMMFFCGWLKNIFV